MQIRLKMSWGQWSKGHIFTEMPGGQARTLIERGVAEELEPTAVKAKDMPSPLNRMMRSGRETARHGRGQ